MWMPPRRRSAASPVRQLTDVLGGMQQRSDRISGIVSVIRDIADQTNLLALALARLGEELESLIGRFKL